MIKNIPCVFVRKTNLFNLDQIADSGQCFRLRKTAEDSFVAVTRHNVLLITYENGYYKFHCDLKAYEEIWKPYFDLATDYEGYQLEMMTDPFLEEAIQYGGGITILRQDFWETAVTFIISQRNNIPRIQNAVETLAENFGDYLTTIGGRDIYSFPTKDQLRGKDLSVAHLGYRQKYIEELCMMDDAELFQIPQQDDITAKNSLLRIKGVGEKVANCIMLFGLHRMSSYPIDVWIQRVIDEVYDGNFDPDKYIGFAGYVQQLQFYYYRKSHNKT